MKLSRISIRLNYLLWFAFGALLLVSSVQAGIGLMSLRGIKNAGESAKQNIDTLAAEVTEVQTAAGGAEGETLALEMELEMDLGDALTSGVEETEELVSLLESMEEKSGKILAEASSLASASPVASPAPEVPDDEAIDKETASDDTATSEETTADEKTAALVSLLEEYHEELASEALPMLRSHLEALESANETCESASETLSKVQHVVSEFGAAATRASEASAQALESVNNSNQAANRSTIATLATSALAVLLGVGVPLAIVPRISGSVRSTVSAMQSIADGELELKEQAIRFKEFRNIQDSMNRVLKTTSALDLEVSELAEAARSGNLAKRADPSCFSGAYRELIVGLNKVIDSFARPAKGAGDVMEHMSEGDLTSRMQGDFEGEFLRLQQSINKAVESVDKTVSRVADSEREVSVAAKSVGARSRELAESSSRQATALEQVSSSLEEMTSMTRQTADNAHQARQIAEETRTAADEGNRNMSSLISALDAIKSSSDEQAKIVETINDIAFQTNILALNAAVEAARAGDAGRGFAVVAEEVRRLAQRSADAAQNTSQMIETSIENAETGVAINGEVARVLSEIQTRAAQASNLISEIAAASSEQAQGIDQINSAVGDVDRATSAAAETSREASKVSDKLNHEVARLREIIDAFQITEVSGTRRTVEPAQFTEEADEANGFGEACDPEPELAVASATETSRPEEFIPFD